MAQTSVNPAKTPRELVENISHQSIAHPGANISFAGKVASIRTCCPRAAASVLSLFHHLERPGHPDITLTVVGRECAHLFHSQIDWDWEKLGQDPAGGSGWYLPAWKSITASDVSRTTVVLISKLLGARDFGRREIMRLILQDILDHHGILGIHGATIGGATSGVFLSNRGGSGKSTLVAQALSRGLRTTGDDFLLIESKPPRSSSDFLYSYFSNLKIHPESPAAPLLNLSSIKGEEKALADIAPQFPRGLVDRHQIVALVIPSVGRETSLEPASHERTLKAVLLSSVRLTGMSQQLFFRVKSLIEKTPCYSLVVGPDPGEGVNVVESLLVR